MEEVDKGCLMIRTGVTGWLFLLVPDHPSSPRQTTVKQLWVYVCISWNVNLNGILPAKIPFHVLLLRPNNIMTKTTNWPQMLSRPKIFVSKSQHCYFLRAHHTLYRHWGKELPNNESGAGVCQVKGKGSSYSITECSVPELIPVLCSQPAGDVSHKPGNRLPLLSATPAVTPATLKRAATNFAAWLNRGKMGVNSLPKTVTRQRRNCDLNLGPSAPESSMLTTRLPSHPCQVGWFWLYFEIVCQVGWLNRNTGLYCSLLVMENRHKCSFHQKSSGGGKKDEAKPMVWVNASSFLQYCDTVGCFI